MYIMLDIILYTKEEFINIIIDNEIHL